MDALLPLLGWCVFILAVEGVLWILFRRRFTQICFAHEDHTIFHFFTLWRLRLLIFIHTLFLLLCVIFGILLLW